MEASPPLSCLILNGVDGVNDDVVRAIGEHLRGLERLSLIGCDGIKREEAVLFAAFLLRDSLSHFFLEDAEVSSERLDHALSLVLEDCSMEVWNEDEYEDESDDESEAEDDED